MIGNAIRNGIIDYLSKEIRININLKILMMNVRSKIEYQNAIDKPQELFELT